MSPDELPDIHARAMLIIRLLLTTITTEELVALIHEIGRMHALMPITDPTCYKAIMGNMNSHEDAIRALVRCRSELVRIVGPGFEV